MATLRGAQAGRPSCLPRIRLPQSRPPDDGFSLVEVMVALGIFLIVSAAVLGLIMTSIRTVRGNADRVFAASLARAELDALRASDTTALALGQTTRTADTAAGDFTVTTTATWVDIGATVNPCQVGPGVNPSKAYLRVRIDVEGGDLQAPQGLDAVIYPTDTAPAENVGTLTVAVTDDQGEPVPGATVTGTNGVQTFQQITGEQGCVFVPDLAVGTSWAVTVGKPGHITESPTGGSDTGVAIEEQANTPLTFALAQPGSLVFTAGTDGYPVPAGMPFEFDPDTLSLAPSAFDAFPVTVTGLWPDDYTGWLRPCVGAGDGSNATAELSAGGTATMELGATRVQLVGPPGENVKAVYTGGPCATTDYPLGSWNDSLLIKTSLPAGTWTFTAPGATPASKDIVLSEGLGLCSVSWDVPDAVDPDAEPTPSPTPTGEPTGEPSEEPTPTPSPTLTLPEVSDPCPSAP